MPLFYLKVYRVVMKQYERSLQREDDSFFLFGMRGSGKSTWCRQNFPNAHWIDLLDEARYQQYLRSPETFGLFLNNLESKSWVVVDEVQRLPSLLNEVHKAIEEKNIFFVLTGSSAKKLRHAGVNLLAGRASKKVMYPLSPWELESDFSLSKVLSNGSLPIIWSATNPQKKLKSYTQLFLKEEIQQEALVRNLSGFARFLSLAALFNAQILNKSNLARDAGIGRSTIEDYFSILVDCHLGFFLNAYEGKLRVKEKKHPKWMWVDPGIVRALKNKKGELDEDEKGSLFESWVISVILCQNEYFGNLFDDIYYWSPAEAKAIEVDCLLQRDDEFCAIEIKSSTRIRPEMFAGLHAIGALKNLKRRILVYCGDQDLKKDGIEILTLPSFLKVLKSGW